MKPRPITLIVCLLLGVVISILVAWRCAIVGERSTTSDIPQEKIEALWREVIGTPRADSDLDGMYIAAAGSTWFGISDESVFSRYDGSSSGEIFGVLRRQTGWPLRCVEGDTIGRTAAPPQYETHDLRGYLPTPGLSLLSKRTEYALPMRPLWIGMTVNSVLYGTLVYLAFWSFAALRRRARLDRTRCPKCKHDLRAAPQSNESMTCSECGTQMNTQLFERPRMIPRWWMTPFLLPLAALLTIWFLGGFDWLWLRYQLRWGESIFSINTIILLALAAIFFFSIGMNAYRDRPQTTRAIIALFIALFLPLIAYVPLHALTLWFSTNVG